MGCREMPIKNAIAAVLIFFLCLFAPSFARGQLSFSPVRTLLTVHTESALGGVDLYHSRNTLDLLGKPIRVVRTREFDRFEWGTSSCKLIVKANGNRVRSVEARGGSGCRYGYTGQGLRLGATMDDAQDIYFPSLFFSARRVPLPIIGFSQSGYPARCPMHPTLKILGDASGKITEMILSDSTICY